MGAVFGADVEKREGHHGAASVWSARVPGDDEVGNYKETMPCDHCMQINGNIPEPRPGISSMPDGLKACERNIVDDILRVQGMQEARSTAPVTMRQCSPRAFTEVGTFARRAT